MSWVFLLVCVLCLSSVVLISWVYLLVHSLAHFLNTHTHIHTVKIVTHELTFSDIEAYFYEHQRRACLNEYKNVNVNRERTNRRDIVNFMNPLLRLRQACCHPQIGSNGIGTSMVPGRGNRLGTESSSNSGVTNKRHMSLYQVLEKYIHSLSTLKHDCRSLYFSLSLSLSHTQTQHTHI